MVIAIISIVAAIFLALYVNKSQDYKMLERDNKWLKEQRNKITEPVSVDEVDLHPLDKESAMEAIRFNGFVPEANEHWITFMSKGEHYVVDSERFPIMVMMKHYGLDHTEWDMDLMHKAAHQVSDELIMCKVLFTGDEEDGIAFQISSIENKYGHFKNCIPRYISIIEESQARMSKIYNEMEAKQKEALSMYPQLGAGASGEKKVMS